MAETHTTTRKEEVQQLWRSLVESALDFFEQAVGEHDAYPKYATLHLATSVELFLKARLMAEHWTLIVAPGKPMRFDQLKSGVAKSVSPDGAFERLKGVLGGDEQVTAEAIAEFNALTAERNKVAHFFHADLDGDTEPRSILQRQCRVWYYLHRLLSLTWASAFAEFKPQLDALDKKMREERKFLNAVFEAAKPDLDRHKAMGGPVIDCPSCGFTSLALDDGEAYTYGLCHVCRYQSGLLRVTCPECEEDILLENGDGFCPKCENFFNPGEVADLIGAESIEDDTGHRNLPINCSDCAIPTVFIVGNRYVCLRCMQEWDEIEVCEWCSEYNTGDMEGSYLHGCSMCEGMLGWKGDKD